VTQWGGWGGPPSITQQSWPAVQQSVPQQTVAPEHVSPFPFSHGGASHLPPAHVDFSPVHCMPQPPQLNGSSCGSTHLSLQHVVPPVQATMHAGPPLLDPLVLPELLPPLEVLLPLVLPEPLPLLPVLPELLPVEPPELVLDEPPLPEELLPPLLLEPPLAPSTDASGEALPSVSVAPPHRAVKTTTPRRTTDETK
jgi:hypothetical protein